MIIRCITVLICNVLAIEIYVNGELYIYLSLKVLDRNTIISIIAEKLFSTSDVVSRSNSVTAHLSSQTQFYNGPFYSSLSLSSGAHVHGGDITDSRDNDNRRRAETLLAEYIRDDAIVTLVLMARRSAEGEGGPRGERGGGGRRDGSALSRRWFNLMEPRDHETWR